jgi:hypothetical protein
MGEVAVQKKESVWDQLQKIEARIMQRALTSSETMDQLWVKDLDNWLAAERELIWKPAIELTEKDNQFEIRVARCRH